MQDWLGVGGPIARHVQERTTRTLDTYRADAKRIEEDLNEEARVRGGGYGRRQVFELVQNGADAVFESGSPGRVHVLVTSESLYCANEGASINEDGVTAILMAHMSRKRGALIGRFGLGFKSVLGVCTAPIFFSRSGSFCFDAQRAKAEVRRATGYVGDTAVLRLAWALDPEHSAGTDPVLRELMGWATTVIKLPLASAEAGVLIAEELRTFPAEFLLFTPLVSELILEDKVAGVGREIRCRRDGDGMHHLLEGKAETTWRIFQLDVHTEELTPDERDNGSDQCKERPAIPLLWAAPLGVRGGRSLFWAFFPTDTETTLSGILNAPWKTNTDRQNLLDGPFNRALIDRATVCVARALPRLVTPEDPGCVLDLLPARTEDARNWADRRLSERLDAGLRKLPFLPCRTGTLRSPEDVLLRPDVVLKLQRDDWAPNDRTSETAGNWCHPTVETRERRARAQRLGAPNATIKEWLVDLAAPRTPGASVAAILLASKVWATLPQEPTDRPRLTYDHRPAEPGPHDEIRQAHIVLTRAGTLVGPGTGLYLRPGEAPETPPQELVAEAVAESPGVAEALRKLGVQDEPDVSAGTRLRNALRAPNVDWKGVWEIAAAVELRLAAAIISDECKHPQVMTISGGWHPLRATLLPGAVVPDDGSRDAHVAIDTHFHRDTIALLRELGATDVPCVGVRLGQSPGVSDQGWYEEYRSECIRQYPAFLQSKQCSSTPQKVYLGFAEEYVYEQTRSGWDRKPVMCPGPLDALGCLSDEGRARFTERLLPLALRQEHRKHWHLGHGTRPERYPAMAVDSPPWWATKRYGRLDTSLGVRRVEAAVHPKLAEWSNVLPVAECDPEVAGILGLPASLQEVPECVLSEALGLAQKLEDDNAACLYGIAAARGLRAPERIRCRLGQEMRLRHPNSVHIAENEQAAKILASAGAAWILVADPEHRQALMDRWGLREARSRVDVDASGDDTPLLDGFPRLGALGKAEVESWVLQPCSRLRWQGKGPDGCQDVQFHREYHILYYLDTLDGGELLKHVLQEMGLPASHEIQQEILDWRQRPERQQLLDRVRACEDLADKLIAAVGEDAVRAQLPDELLASMTNDREIARAALAVHGVEVLRRLRDALAVAGFDPPRRWNGSRLAREFVQELDFPEEYAGFELPRREPFMDVEGPVVLKPLHDYQQPIVERIRELLKENPPGRALLSLPTGAGKTRIAVEALIRELDEAGALSGTVLWIAQTDELCEQAVQCWQQAWRALGPAEGRLRISRYWGKTTDRVMSLDAGDAHVVVATYQTLNHRIGREEAEWVREARCVVVDEAHGSVAPSYTHILERLGLTFRETSRTLIGLTATAFRGMDEDETRRLVARYHDRRLDEGVPGGPDSYEYLQENGFLACVEFQCLEGVQLELDDSERSRAEEFHEMPDSASERLGRDPQRNARILDSVCGLPDVWSVLLFAASVAHAELMAAMLSARGIVARAISGRTDRGARRHYVEQFRAKQIRVLTSYDVLATGFDAPEVQALYVTRPVFSRGRYQQMIGRGLRGPRNGGTECCHIYNVEDNIVNYGEQLAFRHFEHLWGGRRQ